jgi:hypothetical protein
MNLFSSCTSKRLLFSLHISYYTTSRLFLFDPFSVNPDTDRKLPRRYDEWFGIDASEDAATGRGEQSD